MKKVSMVVVLCMVSAALLAGCATGSKGPTDAEQIAGLTKSCLDAVKAKDIDKLLTYYSETFQNGQFGDKQGFKDFLLSAKDMGYLDGIEVDMSGAETVIEGTTATVAPVELKGSFGSQTLGFVATKEAKGWLITGMDI